MYQKHSETSREAWHTLETNADAAEKIYQRIKAAGLQGICAPRIAAELKMVPGTVAARVIGLEREGLIVKLERTEKSPSNRSANVIVAWHYRLEALERGEKVLATKAEESSAGAQDNGEALEILKEVESHISLWTPIHYGGGLHKRIKEFLNQ